MIKFLAVGQQLRISTPVVVSDSINYQSAEAVFKGDAWQEMGISKWAHFTLGDDTYDIPFFGDKILPTQGLDLTAGLWEVYLTGSALEEGQVVTRITTTTALLKVESAQSVNPFPPLTPSFSETLAAQVTHAQETADGVRADADTGAFNGASFVPHLTASGGQIILSWTNDRGLPNPAPVDIKGDKGVDGIGLIIKGYYATLADLEAAVPVPEIGDVYGVGTEEPYDIYVYDNINDTWINNGSLQGPPGEPGDPGEPGEDGEDGYTPVKGVDYFTPEDIAEVAQDAAALVTPAGIGAIADPVSKSSGQVLVWDGTAWVAGNSGVSSVNGQTGDVVTRKFFSGLPSMSIATSAWIEMNDPTYEEFPFYASVALSNVVATDYPEVTFAPKDAISGIICPVADTYDGGVYVYASEVPEDTVSIMSILIQR